MLKILKNMKSIQKLGIGSLLLICIIVFAFIAFPKVNNVGSAAKDPNACQIGGLMISLDPDIWNCENFQVVREVESQGIIRSSDSAVVRLKYELENPEILSNPCIQFNYFQFEDYTYEEYKADSDAFIEESNNIENYRKSSTQYEGYDVSICEYTVKDGNSYYSISMGKGACAYGITYSSHGSMYNEYLDKFMNSLNSMHIKHF